MTLDITRNSFDALLDFSGVLQQQGRVLLDSEHNEMNRIVEQRVRLLGMDAMSAGGATSAIVPRTTAEGFKVSLDGAGILRIGLGRAYVDGLLAENHGRRRGDSSNEALDWDRRGEQRVRGAPTGGIAYAEQPSLFIPGPAAQGGGAATDPAEPPKNAAYLVYLDVWRREVSALQHPDLVEPALGFDTTGRLQTVWQVRILTGIGNGVTCATKDEDIPGWTERTRPSGGRLSTHVNQIPATEDLCVLPPGSGYRGLEHRTYRVEIHDGGAPGTATFKWARHHGSVGAAVTRVEGDRKAIVVDRLGPDDELSIHQHDWIEVLDDATELAGRSGEVRRVEKIRDDGRTLELSSALPAGLFPVDGQGKPQALRHMRVRRWDQKGAILATNPAAPDTPVALQTLGAASSGVITVPANAALRVRLEDGVEVSFAVRDGGAFRPGDHWTFVARAATAPGGVGTVEPLVQAPPRGVHHHYGRLAVVDKDGHVSDCRVLWPSEAGEASCGCTVCVEASAHNQGVLTIQQAVDQVIASGGGTVCLGPGEFRVDDGVLIKAAKGLRLCGHGAATTLLGGAKAPCITVNLSADVTIDRLVAVGAGVDPNGDGGDGDEDGKTNLIGEKTIFKPAGNPAAAEVIAVVDCLGVRIDRCGVRQTDPGRGTAAAIGLGGVLLDIAVIGCFIEGTVGIANRWADREGRRVDEVLLLGLRIVDNAIKAESAGIALEEEVFHAGPTTIEGNIVLGGEKAVAGVMLLGVAHALSSTTVRGNHMGFVRIGLGATLDGLHVADNRIVFTGRAAIAVRSRHAAERLERTTITGNELLLCLGRGVELGGRMGSILVESNAIAVSLGEAIATDADSDPSIDHAIVAANRIALAGLGGKAVAGVALIKAEDAEVRDNLVVNVGTMTLGADTTDSGARGVFVGGCLRARVRGNTVGPVGSVKPFKTPVVGVEVLAAMESAEVFDNAIRRDEGATPDASPFVGIRVQMIDAGKEGGAALGVGSYTFQAIAGKAFMKSKSGVSVLAPSATTAVSVRGNSVVARGGGSAAEVASGKGHASIADNRLTSLGGSAGGAPALVAKSAGLIVSDNVLETSPDAPAAVLESGTDKEPTAVVHGNLFRGATIRLNGLPTLPAPWDKLNVRF